jgi:hypothetical protein
VEYFNKAVVTIMLRQLFIFCLAAKPDALTFAPRSRAAVARWAHNPKVGSSILPFATGDPPSGRILHFKWIVKKRRFVFNDFHFEWINISPKGNEV